MLTHPSGFFERLHFGPYWVLPPQIFTRPTTPKLYFQSDFGRRAASSLALPHISSCLFFSLYKLKLNYYLTNLL